MECPLPGQIFIMLLALITYFAKKITLDQSVASHMYIKYLCSMHNVREQVMNFNISAIFRQTPKIYKTVESDKGL